MKKKIFLHIGVHKTGSTSFQRWCMSNRGLLRENGYLYPVSGMNPDGNHSKLAWAISGDARGKRLDIHDLLSEIRSCSQGNVIISGEEFEYLDKSKVEELKAALSDYDVRVIVFLRPQHEMIRSQYGEWIRGFLAIEDFSDFWRFHAGLQDYDFLALYEKWSSSFGSKNVSVVSHPKSRKRKYGALSELQDIIGIAGMSPSLEDRNISDCAEVLFLWRYVLIKIEGVYGYRFGLNHRWMWDAGLQNYAEVAGEIGGVFKRVKRIYHENSDVQTKLIGYSSGELASVQNLFKPKNEQLFESIGERLWEDTNPDESIVEDFKIEPTILKMVDSEFWSVRMQPRSTSIS